MVVLAMIGAVGRRQPFVTVLEPDGRRRLVPISASPFVIGRSSDCHLVLYDMHFPRQQLKIVHVGDRFCLEHTGSMCPVFLNGERIPQEPGTRRELQPNDVVSFGTSVPYELVFTYDDGDVDAA